MTRTERQNLAIDRWKQAGCRNCIVGVTGVGKTRIALMAIRRFFNKNPDKKVVVVVPTLILQDQWKDEVKNFGIEEPVEILVLNTASKKEFECDFLIIDDFADSVTLYNNVGSVLNSILETRAASRLPTVLVTPFPVAELVKKCDMRISGKLQSAKTITSEGR